MPFWQFWIVSVFSSFPLVVSLLHLEIGARYEADLKGLQFVRTASLFFSNCMLLYFAWYSYITTIFVIVYFLPSATALCVTSALLVIVLCFSVGASLRINYLKLDQQPLIIWFMFAISIILFYFSRSSYLYLLVNLAFVVFFTPAVIQNAIVIGCGALSDYIVSQGVAQLLFSTVQIVVVLLITLIVGLISFLGKWKIVQLIVKLAIVVSLAVLMLLLFVALQIHTFFKRFSFYSYLFHYFSEIWYFARLYLGRLARDRS
jgi:hypothetical protein